MANSATKTEALLRLARRGPLRARDLDEADIPRAYLRRLCNRGLLEQVDRDQLMAFHKAEKFAICVMFNSTTSFSRTVIPEIIELIRETKTGKPAN